MTEETRDPRSNAEERATMEPAVKKRQLGQTLVLIGVLLLATDVIAVALVPSDLRSGHSFVTILLAADVAVAITLIIVGSMLKAKAKSRLNV